MAQASCLGYLTECPICFERLLPPVDTCIKGHAVCQKCRKEVTTCPTCRGEFSNNQNVLLNQMLESVPIACKNESLGCNEKMVLVKVPEHEKVCDFREEKCCFCEKTVQFNSFCDHLFYKHSRGSRDDVYYVNCYETFRLEVDTTETDEDDICDLIFLKDIKTHFIIRYVLEEGHKLILSIQHTEEREEATNYFYELRINQKLSHDGPRAVFTCFGICIPYFHCYSDWRNHKRALNLDLNQIFLSEKLPAEFVMSFQIKQRYQED